jgi:hypothetical protein
MGELRLVPKHWFSWDFRLEDAVGMLWGEVGLSSWRERGSVTVGGERYRVSRHGVTGPFVLEGAQGELAKAVKVSAFRQAFTLTADGRDYTLKRRSWWRREFELFCRGASVGSVAPASWFACRGDAFLPDDIPPPVCAFVVWLTLLMWKRDSDAAAISAAGGS